MKWRKRLTRSMLGLVIMGLTVCMPHLMFAATDRQTPPVLSTTKAAHFIPSSLRQTFQMTFTVHHSSGKHRRTIAVHNLRVVTGNSRAFWMQSRETLPIHIIDHGVLIPPQVAQEGQNCNVWAYVYPIVANPHEIEIIVGSVTNNASNGWIWQNISGAWTLSYLFDRTWHVSYRGSYPNENLFASTWDPEPKYLYNLPNGEYQLTVNVTGSQINEYDLFTRPGSGSSYAYQQIS